MADYTPSTDFVASSDPPYTPNDYTSGDISYVNAQLFQLAGEALVQDASEAQVSSLVGEALVQDASEARLSSLVGEVLAYGIVLNAAVVDHVQVDFSYTSTAAQATIDWLANESIVTHKSNTRLQASADWFVVESILAPNPNIAKVPTLWAELAILPDIKARVPTLWAEVAHAKIIHYPCLDIEPFTTAIPTRQF